MLATHLVGGAMCVHVDTVPRPLSDIALGHEHGELRRRGGAVGVVVIVAALGVIGTLPQLLMQRGGLCLEAPEVGGRAVQPVQEYDEVYWCAGLVVVRH